MTDREKTRKELLEEIKQLREKLEVYEGDGASPDHTEEGGTGTGVIDPFRQIVENIEIYVWLIDIASRKLVYVNPSLEQALGMEREKIREKLWPEMKLIVSEDRKAVKEAFQNSFTGDFDDSERLEYRIRVGKDGETRWIWNRFFNVVDENGEPYRCVGVAADVTERQKAQEALMESEERFRQIADNIHETFWIIDLQADRVLYVNPAFERVFGHPVDGFHKDPWALLRTSVHLDDREAVQKTLERAKKGATKKELQVEYRITGADQKERWIWDRYFPITDERGKVYRLAGIAMNITDRKQAEQQLIFEAFHDSLTGLNNRRAFFDQLKKEVRLAKRNQYPLSLGICDLDRFKSINDLYGANKGDEVLCEFAKLMTQELREEDLAARYGGDEFCILFSHIAPKDAAIACERIRSKFERFQFTAANGRKFNISVTFGLAELDLELGDGRKLLEYADQSLYFAKVAGRNRVAFRNSSGWMTICTRQGEEEYAF